MLSRFTFFITVSFLLGLSSGASAAELKIDVKNLRSSNGNVHFAIYSDPKTFPDKEGMLYDIILPVKNSKVEATFSDLKPGSYAFAIFHDENSNKEFDQGFFDIPLEGYGFSNDAKVFFSPPDFKDAEVKISKANKKISISMVYMID